MSELRFTETNAADDSAGRAFGLDGNLYLPLVGAIVGGIALFALLAFVLRLNHGLAAAVGSVPLILISVWVSWLKQGKAPGYDRDRIEALFGQGDLIPLTHTKSTAETPDARLIDHLLVFGSFERGGAVVKGYWLEPGDRRGASVAALNAFQEQIKGLLALIGPGRALQCHWTCDCDYRGELRAFHGRTPADCRPEVRAVRDERLTRYWWRMEEGTLRRERLALFLSIDVDAYSGNVRSRAGLKTHYESLLKQYAAQFEEFLNTLQAVFGPDMTVRPMDAQAHFLCAHRFLNPSAERHRESIPAFDPSLTLQENCWHSEGVGQPDGGFVLDGYHHAILTLSRWPQHTRPGIVTHLTGLPFLDYAITVNVRPIASRREIEREEKKAERLRGEYATKARPSVLVALRKKERKVEQLAGGFARPFHVDYIIRTWAPTREKLREKVAAIEAAIQGMDGAQYLECSLPTTAKKLFFASWPGWTHSSYRHRQLYAEDTYLADVLPFSATFSGDLANAEAIFDGGHLNLVGVSSHANGSPQHAFVCGMTGSGKSEFIRDLFFQSAGFFDYTLIADIGFSHRSLSEALGETPIVIHPDGNLTLNYLDTQGLPVSHLHLATSVALLARMAGKPESAQDLALRQALLTTYVQQLYRDAHEHWARRHPDKADEVSRFAYAIERWRALKAGTPLDAFIELRDRQVASDDEALSFIAEPTEAEITRFAQEAAGERLIAHTAAAFFSPEEFPTHGALVELLAYARLPEHNKDEIERLAALLRAWTMDGAYGKLFDGVTNVSLRRKVAHFELGLIPEPAVELKAAAGLLISGVARQHIISLPKAQRKRALFEEVSQFLDIPGGEQIVAESYAQLRKHNCWAVSVIQQYGTFRESRIRPAVIGNAKQFFLLRQSDRSDMEKLAQDVGLPESAVAAIQRYPLPEHQPAADRFSSICYFTPTSQPPQCGTIRHMQAKEERRAA